MRLEICASTRIGVVAIAFWAIAVPYVVHQYFGGDERGLLRLGTDFRHPAALADAPTLGPDGYDGQFFAALATDPLLLRPETPLMLDSPVYRAGRIGLPLAAWLVTAGRDRAAILAYQLLCWILGVLAVWVVAVELERLGASPWWAATLVMAGGTAACMMGCLPDLAAVTLVLVALSRHGAGRKGVVALLAAAALTRETTLVAAVAVALVELRERRLRSAATALLVPFAVVVAWRLWVFARLGNAGSEAVGGNLGLPLSWIPQKLAKPLDAVEVVALVALALGFAGLPALLPSIRRWTAVEAAYAGFAALFLVASGPNYLVIWWGYSRTVLPLAALSVLVAAQPGPQWRRWLFRSVALAWSLVGVMLLYWWAIGLAAALAIAALLPPRARAAVARAR